MRPVGLLRLRFRVEGLGFGVLVFSWSPPRPLYRTLLLRYLALCLISSIPYELSYLHKGQGIEFLVQYLEHLTQVTIIVMQRPRP